jgi:PAS domain S-box-containing protein
VDYQETVKRLEKLALDESHVNDGAFVIHEVLYIPGYRDWMFPSKANIDALMEHIRAEQMKTVSEKATEMPPRRPGEVNYAQHITSGLIGSNNSPLLTANQLGQITDVNEVACEKIGIEAAGLIGRDLSAFFVNPDRIIACLKSCFARGKETASPHRLKLPDGSTTPVLLDGMTYRDRTDGFVHSVLLCINPVSPASYAEFNQSRNYARGLLEASLDALMVIDKDGVITDVNEAVVLVTGLPRESLLGSPFMSLFSDPDKAQQGVQKTFAEGIVRNYVLMLLSTSGEQIPVSFNATIYQDTDGVVQGIFAAARDIRERLKMMHELEEAKTYARGLIECCLDLMVTINREGIITDANRAAAVMTGHPHEAIIGTPFRNFFDDSERAQAGVDQTFRDGEVRNYTMNLRTAESNLIPVSFNATLYRDPFGTVQGVFAIARSQA